MSKETPEDAGFIENADELLNGLENELKDLYSFRDLFFDNHPIEQAAERNKLVDEKKKVLIEKFNNIDVDTQIPQSLRAKFLYLKGRCYNINPDYDAQALQCLSRAVKLNPNMVDAWNELGECYWKNSNVKDAKASFEGALKHERNRLSLRCLSIIMRQEIGSRSSLLSEDINTINKSVEIAKEAVTLDIKDGMSWTVLANAYLCQFFIVKQDQAILKLCLSAYKQAESDPVARGQPDLYYNKAIALKYEEMYNEALDGFDYACRLDPLWDPAKDDQKTLVQYLNAANELCKTKGKIKTKKLQQMVQTMDSKMWAEYKEGPLQKVSLAELRAGENPGCFVLGRVVGSIKSDTAVPFTFAIVDESMVCVCVTVYNWADGRGAIIGDCVVVPEPKLAVHKLESPLVSYDFKSIRVNNPLKLHINGKKVSRNQFAVTKVKSTYRTN